MADAAVPAQGLTKYPELDRAAVEVEILAGPDHLRGGAGPAASK
jgi:hypothetical protein